MDYTLNIENSYINGNSSNNKGGGVYIAKSLYIPIVQFSNTTVSNNTSLYNDGGGVSLNEVNATFENCIISENTAANGAGINSVSSTVTVNNSSISGNVASVNGGGFYFQTTHKIF